MPPNTCPRPLSPSPWWLLFSLLFWAGLFQTLQVSGRISICPLRTAFLHLTQCLQHSSTDSRISFCFKSYKPSTLWHTTFPPCIHLSVDGLHPYLHHCNEHVGAETSSRSWFQCLCIFTQKRDDGSSESYGTSIFTFLWGPSSLFSPVAAPYYIPANRARGFPILCSFTNTHYLWF